MTFFNEPISPSNVLTEASNLVTLLFNRLTKVVLSLTLFFKVSTEVFSVIRFVVLLLTADSNVAVEREVVLPLVVIKFTRFLLTS